MATPTHEGSFADLLRALDSTSVSGPFKRNATYADLESIPENWVGEIIDGDLWAFARPATGHAVILAELTKTLGPFSSDDGPNGWVILADVEVAIGPHLLVPDLVGWRRARMPVIPDVTVVELPPDWVCEGMSPSTARLDRGRKREIYGSAGVGHIWFADPVHHTLEVLALDGAGYRVVATAGDDERGHFAPFDAIAFEVAKLWRR